YGDPLYAINAHTGDQLAMEARVGTWSPDRTTLATPTAVCYMRAKFISRPFEAVDTLATGVTAYPFLNKWTGFDRWMPRLGDWLSGASLACLILFTVSGRGPR